MNNSSSSSATQCCAIAGPSRATGISMSSSSQLPGGAHSNQRSDPEDQEDRSQRGELSVPVETKSSRKHKRQKSNKASKGGDQQPQSAAVTRDQPPAGQGKHHAKNKKRENKAKFEKRDVRQRAERRVYSHRAVFTTSQDDLISTSVGSVGFKERFAAKAINPASSVEDIVREVQSQDRPTRDAEVWIAKGKNMDKVRTCLNAEINDSKTGADVTLVVEGMEHGDKMVAVAQQLLLNNEIYAVVFNPADSAVPVSRCHPSEQDISESLDEIGVVGTDKQEFKVVDDLQSTKTARQQRDSLTPADMAKVWRSTDSSSMAARAPASSLGLKRRDPQKLVNLSPKAYYQDLRIAREATDALLAAQGAAPSKSSISTVKKNLPIQSAPAVLPGETDNNFQEDKKDITLFYDGDKDKCLTKPLRKRLPAVMDKFTREFHFWALQATTGMLTIRHYDAAGGLSWIRMVAGEKLWIVYKMDPIEGLVKVDAVVLRPGSVIVMRPRTIHQVYTISNSICHGGHFYLLSHLHESLANRFRERADIQCPTNQCLPFGHAAMIWFAVLLTTPDFEPAKYHMNPGVFEECKRLLRRTATTTIVKAIPTTYVTAEKQAIVEVLRHSGWLTACTIDRLI